jgi:hypothetical protein
MSDRHPPPRAAVARAIDAPLGPALRLAVGLGGARARELALARAHSRGRDRDARAAVARLAAARAAQLGGGAGHGRIPRARHALCAARRAGLAVAVGDDTNV